MQISTPRLAVGDIGASDAGILAASFMLAAAGLVHLSLTPEHLAQWWILGTAFAAAAALQFGLAIVLLRRPSRDTIAGICALNAAIVAVWLLSRSAGLPLGPDAGQRETIGWLDALTTLDELLLIALLCIEGGWTACRDGGRLAATCRICGALVAVLLTLAFAGGAGHV